MIAKVVYMCAIMVAVQSRVVLYGTSILDLITSSDEIDETHLEKNSSSETAEESNGGLDDWNYSIYDIGSKILHSIRRNIQHSNTVNDASSPSTEVSSTIPSPKFNVVTHDSESATEIEDTEHDATGSVQILLPGNDSIANSELLGLSKWYFAKDITHRPGLAAFGYHN